MDNNSSVANGESESSKVTQETCNEEFKTTGTGFKSQSIVGPWRYLKLGWTSPWAVWSNWTCLSRVLVGPWGGLFLTCYSMNFYGGKCVILCSYITWIPNFSKCYNRGFSPVFMFVLLKTKYNCLSQCWWIASLFRKQFWKCCICNECSLELVKKPKAFLKKTHVPFGWIFLTIFDVPFNGGESKPRLQREEWWCFTTVNTKTFFKWKKNYVFISLSRDFLHYPGILDMIKIPIESILVSLN